MPNRRVFPHFPDINCGKMKLSRTNHALTSLCPCSIFSFTLESVRADHIHEPSRRHREDHVALQSRALPLRSPQSTPPFNTVGPAPLSKVTSLCSVLQALTLDRPSTVTSLHLLALGREKVGGCHVRWSHIPAKVEYWFFSPWGKCGEQLADCATRYSCTESTGHLVHGGVANVNTRSKSA